MKKTINKPGSLSSRRGFIKSSGAATAGLLLTPPLISVAGASQKSQDKLALNGGPKAVTATHDDSTTWPRYGAEEEKAVLNVLRKPDYQPNDDLELAWKEHFKLPYCKALFNGTSAITAM